MTGVRVWDDQLGSFTATELREVIPKPHLSQKVYHVCLFLVCVFGIDRTSGGVICIEASWCFPLTMHKGGTVPPVALMQHKTETLSLSLPTSPGTLRDPLCDRTLPGLCARGECVSSIFHTHWGLDFNSKRSIMFSRSLKYSCTFGLFIRRDLIEDKAIGWYRFNLGRFRKPSIQSFPGMPFTHGVCTPDNVATLAALIAIWARDIPNPFSAASWILVAICSSGSAERALWRPAERPLAHCHARD